LAQVIVSDLVIRRLRLGPSAICIGYLKNHAKRTETRKEAEVL